MFVGSPSNSRLCKLRSTAWLAQLPLHLPHAHAHLTTLCASGRGSPPGEHCWPSPTLLLRLHVPLLTGFAPVVARALHHSRRCSHHRLSVPQPIPPVAPSRLARPPRTCRASGSSLRLMTTVWVGFCSTRCTFRRCHVRRSPPPVQPHCRCPDYLGPAPPDCPVRFCNLHCTSPRCVVHDPLSLSGNGQGRLANERRLGDPPLLSFMHSIWVSSTAVVCGVLMVLSTMASWAW